MTTRSKLLGLHCIATCALPFAAMAEHPYLFLDYEDADSCMTCHWSPMGQTKAVDLDEIMQSVHWTWEKTDSFTGEPTGKVNVINNYCVAVPSNEPRCTSCHIGVGWKDDTFDFTDSSQIDCLICHDGTGTYKKIPTGAGAPVADLDYQAIFRSLQKPDRNNCGVCHFYGGGGDAVKHGDLDSTMANPSRDLDVHMGSVESGGLNFDCTTCHVPEAGTHTIVGTRYSKSHNDAATCIACHSAMTGPGNAIHQGAFMIDEHLDKVACQTCHIPTFARGGKKTKTYWDWSTAGQFTESGAKIATEDYNTMKGSFEWHADVTPDYAWSNGKVRYVDLDDTFSGDERVTINQLQGSQFDDAALIFPVKRFVAIQPFDATFGNLLIPNLFPNPSPTADADAYWVSYDWNRAVESGMASVGREFSGNLGFLESEMLWILNHMVAPKEQSLQCFDCHSSYGQFKFEDLGYRPTHASSLQHLYQFMVWAGFEVLDQGWVNTGSWLGYVNVWGEPWVYSLNLDALLYIPENAVQPYGGWAYWSNTADWKNWLPTERQGWFYAPSLNHFVYLVGGDLNASEGWSFILN